MLVRQLQNDLPAPSDFARPSVWPEAQEGAPILCLHPPNARGLPLITLHDVFLCFQQEMSGPPPKTPETVAVQIAASELCSGMGEAFEDERSHSKAFDECVSGVLEKGEADCELKPYLSGHYGKIDRCIREANIPIALREDNLDMESPMHICKLLAVTTSSWGFSLAAATIIQMPATFSLTERHVS